MFKSLMATAALAGLMTFGASSAQAMYGQQHGGGQYAAGYGYGAAPCQTACAPAACVPSCPRKTQCTDYRTNYRSCLPRYVAGDCMMSGANSCRTGCW